MPKTITTEDGIKITGIPDHLDVDGPEVRQRVAEARAERDGTAVVAAPVVEAPVAAPEAVAQSPLASAVNLGMEGVTAVNRAGMGLFDIATAPVQALMTAAGLSVPTLQSLVPEKGAFAGPGLATDVAAGTGELATMAATGGGLTRMISSSLNDIARFGEKTLSRVLRTMGQTTPAQDVMFGAIGGAGGEILAPVGQEIAGDTGEEVGRLVGQILSPVAWVATTSAIQRIGIKALESSAPSVEQLRGASRGLFTKLDEAGIVANPSSSNAAVRDIKAFITEHQPEGAVLTRLNRLVKAAEEGNLSYTFLDRQHGNFRDLGAATDTNGTIAKKAADLADDLILRITPTNSQALGGDTVNAVIKDARSFWRRASVSNTVEDLFTNTFIKSQAKRGNFNRDLRRQFGNLITNKKKSQFFTAAEKDAIKEYVSGGRLEKLLENVAVLSPNSNDWIKILTIGSIGGLFNPVTAPTSAAILAGLTLTEGASLGASRTLAGNANYLRAVIRAGIDGEEIAKAYLRNTPRRQQSPDELTRLFLNNRADLSALRNSGLMESTLISDAVALGIAGQQVMREEQQSPVEGTAAPL